MPPYQNNCEQSICCSLLHDKTRQIAFRPVEILALSVPPDSTALDYADQLLAASGYTNAQEARQHLMIPPRRLICVETTKPDQPVADRPEELLRIALLLGICGPCYYDPQRPLIWTETRLRRRLQLFAPGTFYSP